MAIDPSDIEQHAQSLARLAGETWKNLKEDARDHYRKLAQKQLEQLK